MPSKSSNSERAKDSLSFDPPLVAKSSMTSTPSRLSRRNTSMPEPPSSSSLPAPPTRMSLPSPPNRSSLPLPPNSWSWSRPPSSRSLPSPPSRVSRSLPPLRKSLPIPPSSLSSPSSPRSCVAAFVAGQEIVGAVAADLVVVLAAEDVLDPGDAVRAVAAGGAAEVDLDLAGDQAEVERVGAGPAVILVLAVLARVGGEDHEGVVAVAAEALVVAGAEGDDVVAVAALDDVVAALGVDDVVAGCPVDHVVLVVAEDRSRVRAPCRRGS